MMSCAKRLMIPGKSKLTVETMLAVTVSWNLFILLSVAVFEFEDRFYVQCHEICIGLSPAATLSDIYLCGCDKFVQMKLADAHRLTTVIMWMNILSWLVKLSEIARTMY